MRTHHARGIDTVWRALVALLTSWCAAHGAGAEGGAGPIGPNGWTIFNPQPETRIIYVSASDGEDVQDAVFYHADDPEIGGDPFHPVGSVRAYQSINHASQFLRDGKPDWLLLKRGDAWEESFDQPLWDKSGAGPGAYMLIGAYGEGPRPIIDEFKTRYGVDWPEEAFDYLAIVGLQFEEGLDRRIGGRGFLVEDCFFNQCDFLVQGFGPMVGMPYLSDVSIRRCVAYRNFVAGGNAQNLYVALTDGLLVEESVFDLGGWDPGNEPPNQLSHNVYIQKDVTNVVFRGNISSRASSHGLQMRRGGVCEDNLFLQNPISLQFGSASINNWPEGAAQGVIRRNVILDGRDITEGNNRGFAIWCDQTSGVEVVDNIVAHQKTGDNARGIAFGEHYRGVHVHNNVIYNWTMPDNPVFGGGIQFEGSPRGSNNRVENNIIQQPLGGKLVIHNVSPDGFTYAGNTYFSTNPNDRWFMPGSTIEGWLQFSGETGARARRVAFEDPSRNIESYMASIGHQGGLHVFLANARQQSRDNWQPEFTATAVNAYIRDGFAVRETASASLSGFEVMFGRLEGGSLDDLRTSDDRRLEVRSQFAFSGQRPFITESRIDASAPQMRGELMSVDVESQVSTPGAVVEVSLYNWQTGTLDTVWSGSVALEDSVARVSGLSTSSYVGAEGAIRLHVRHGAIAVFSADGFVSGIDVVEVRFP